MVTRNPWMDSIRNPAVQGVTGKIPIVSSIIAHKMPLGLAHSSAANAKAKKNVKLAYYLSGF